MHDNAERQRQLEVVVLIGVQAAGKSTFYRRYFARSHRLISKDLMKSARRKTTRQELLIQTALASGQSVVLDNTNPALEDRNNVIEIGKAQHARIIAYYFPSDDIRVNIARNRWRPLTKKVLTRSGSVRL